MAANWRYRKGPISQRNFGLRITCVVSKTVIHIYQREREREWVQHYRTVQLRHKNKDKWQRNFMLWFIYKICSGHAQYWPISTPWYPSRAIAFKEFQQMYFLQKVSLFCLLHVFWWHKSRNTWIFFESLPLVPASHYNFWTFPQCSWPTQID